MMENLQTLDKTYIAGTYGRFPLNLVSGKGSLVQDDQGREYIDLGSGIAVTSFGIADDQWADAVTRQIHTLQHTSNLYYTEPCVLLARKLCEKTGMKKVFFGNSGAEANECAIKVARKYAAEKKGTEYYWIITLKNSFHGRTLTGPLPRTLPAPDAGLCPCGAGVGGGYGAAPHHPALRGDSGGMHSGGGRRIRHGG